MSKTTKTILTGVSAPVGITQPDNIKVQVETYLSTNYDIRYNEVLGMVEYKRKCDSKFVLITDYVTNSLEREMILDGIPCNVTLLRKTLKSDYSPIYNPFETYFNGLPAWDGHTDHIMELSKTVTTTDDFLWHTCFRKWLVAMVGCALEDDVVNHTAIVFAGKQGLGKTTWILNLLPAALKQYCYSGTIDAKNKDTVINLSETILINMDELETLKSAEIGALKELITKSSIRLRRSFGTNHETMPRRASFAGSVNGKEFLSDTSGNRRFLTFEVTSIDYKHNISLEDVYAQALQLFNSGFQHWFNPIEIAEINKNNEQFRSLAVEEELLTLYFESCAEDEADYFYSATEVINWLGLKAKISLSEGSKIKMGKALRACGFLRLKRRDRYVYALKEICHVPNLPTTNSLSTKNLVEGLFG
ncbi:VapE domain-containing protein [Mucilaginibacter flavidus]|uniref:VapE domain-containing protein n=1 Tax=Mucilaginibacter flavidus TaxID=2949309 RepID=UPI002093AEEB|nr:VapE domain-containing protein [Mucilaginibacter flavidus]MCO5948089.1 DUF5906 domain-containing protein [Mucilaginibacter flavidus]